MLGNLMRARNPDGDLVSIQTDADKNLKVVTEAITIENVNVIAPLGVTADNGDLEAVGSTDDAAWNGILADATVVSLLKSIHAQLVAANLKLDDVVTNTGT